MKHDLSARHDSAIAVDELLPLGALDEALGRADHVCVTLPLTPETHHLLDARRLARMRPSTYVYNVSRGAVIDEAALVAALRSGELAGAGLDVYEEEPLPPESPLWDLDNVILTPHVAGVTPLYYERTAALFAENLDSIPVGPAARQSVRPRSRLLNETVRGCRGRAHAASSAAAFGAGVSALFSALRASSSVRRTSWAISGCSAT